MIDADGYHPAYTIPMEKGYYERFYSHGKDGPVFIDYWDGELWRVSRGGVRQMEQQLRWRKKTPVA